MKKLTLAIFLLCIGIISNAQTENAQPEKELTIEQIFKNEPNTVIGEIPSITGWLDNHHYIETVKESDGNITTSSVNIKTNKKSPCTDNSTKVFIKDGDVFYTTASGESKQLTNTKEIENNPTLSPNKQWVAFTRNNNLFAVNIVTGVEKQYTFDGSDVILNGYSSWVYYEEILGRPTQYRAFWWSPDSKYIAFFRSDDTNVPTFPIYSSKGQHGTLENTRYPKAGDPNPEVKTGIVPVDGGTIIWADFNEKDDQYFGQPFWTPDSKALWLQWMPREQDILKIYSISPTSGAKGEVYHEQQKTWVDWKDDIIFLANNEGYIIQNDTDGYDQLYHYSNKGELITQLTSGKLWKTKLLTVDEQNKTVYFTSRGENTTRNDFYSVKLNGKDFKRLSFGEYNHQIQLSPDAKHFVTSYSNANTPTQINLISTNKLKTIRQLGNAKTADFDNYNLTKNELHWITTSDGFRIPAMLTMPLNFDSNKKYPVIISIYGGPNSGTVADTWKGINASQWWAKEGVIQIAIDHRGSGHCGKNGLNYMHRSLGKYEMIDYIEWVKWLHEKPYVDKSKIAIQGGSYGGYITAMALTYASDYFNYGIASFGVMDWLLYDSHYTERYMDTQKSNPEGYKNGSVLSYVDKYKTGQSMLRIVHGTADDNVHMQNSMQLIDALQDLNAEFQMMLYPDCKHGWRGDKQRHDRNETLHFYYKYLLNKPVPKDVGY